jgi:hypothetical protein
VSHNVFDLAALQLKPLVVTVKLVEKPPTTVFVNFAHATNTSRFPGVVADPKPAAEVVKVASVTMVPVACPPSVDWTRVAGIYPHAYGTLTINPTFKVCTSAAEVTENSSSEPAGIAVVVTVRFSFLIAPVSTGAAIVAVNAG